MSDSLVEQSELLKTREAADLASVSVRTLYRYEELGYITSLRTPSGQRRFRRADVEALLTINDDGAA